jgi:hypothetical protein
VIVRAFITVSVSRLVTLCGVGLVASLTVTLTVKVPAAPGVPVMAPELALMVSAEGRPVADQLKGVFPPEVARVVLYAVLAMPLGSVLVVIDNAAAMVNGICLVTV